MSTDHFIEDVPRFVKRYGDNVMEGSNNTIIILGSDRAANGPADRSNGIREAGAGTIHMIAGRASSDPDFTSDDSFIYLTRKSNVDTNLNLAGVEQAQDQQPGAIIKSDLIRIVGRRDIKICANDDDRHFLFMDGNKIKINFADGPATVVIEDRKITITMGSNTIFLDNTKAVVTVNRTIATLDGSKIKLDSPKVQLVGGCQIPWDNLFLSVKNFCEIHTHMSAVGPTTHAQNMSSDVTSRYTTWRQDVVND